MIDAELHRLLGDLQASAEPHTLNRVADLLQIALDCPAGQSLPATVLLLNERHKARLATPVSDLLKAALKSADLNAPSAWDILSVCMELAVFLIGQNKKYGDSALKPLRIVSKASPDEAIRVRMDDKLNRLLQGSKIKEDEDVMKDLVGYWVLLRVLEKRNAALPASVSETQRRLDEAAFRRENTDGS